MTHAIGAVQYEGQVHGWVLDLPGCIGAGATVDALTGPLGLAIAEYEAWLRHHGEQVDDDDAWEIVETIDGRALAATGGEWCFEYDKAGMSRDELETLIRWMQHARDDLVAAVEGLPDVVLGWEPPSSVLTAADPWAQEPRTIGGIFEHVLQLEVYYRDGLQDGPSRGIFERVGDQAAERAVTVELLRRLDDAARSRVYRPVRPGRTASEDWTVRKAVRRVLSHERVHTAEIWQRRSWLLLGIPQVERR
jgi:hypothetical protein